jgi:restriction system protein
MFLNDPLYTAALPPPERNRVKFMKWKMSPNSLYAVLLRSPWWASLLVVLVIVLVSGALLPAEYRPFGMLASLPFLGIGLYRAWQQGQAPNPKRVAQALERASAMPWREFSAVLQQAYKHQGYDVAVLPGPAADLKLTFSGRTTLVSGKRWKAAAHGVEPLRELVSAKESLDADLCTYISLGAVSEQARSFAKEQGITLVSGQALAMLILSHE